LEDIIEYISKIGYAYMAVTGEKFCDSCWNGFLLNMKYCAKFYFAQTIAGMFVFIGILMCAGANIGIGYVLVKYVTKEVEKFGLENMGPVFIVFIIISFLIPAICLGMFDEAVVATLQCYAVDTDLHQG